MTSSMLERTMRRKSGAENVPRVIAGSTSDHQESQPDTGSIRHCTAKSSMSMMPVQKTGMDWPRKTTSVTAWSTSDPRRTAL